MSRAFLARPGSRSGLLAVAVLTATVMGCGGPSTEDGASAATGDGAPPATGDGAPPATGDGAPPATASPGEADGTIRGVVEGPDGPEAGVWVIAETSDLGTPFTKIVVTDGEGRFVLPELPSAIYEVWVRGYGLRDSEGVAARPGDEIALRAEAPASAREAAAVYPASYWYSMVEVPDAEEFPGTGSEGNGISPRMRNQAEWVDQMKQGCQLCHQMGNRTTREISHIEDRFETTEEAWDHRVTFGQRGARMSGAFSQFGRDRAVEVFADWTDRIAAGEVPPEPPRPRGIERNVVLTMWDWGHAYSYMHDEIATDKRDPRVNAGGLVYGVSMSDDQLVMVDPTEHWTRQIRVPVRDDDTPSYFPLGPFEPSPFWGNEAIMNAPANVHNPMMDHRGRVWMTSRIRHPANQPEWCGEGSGNPYAEYFPLSRSGRQASVYDPETESFTLVDTCFGTHHLQFAEDDEHTLYFSGDGNVIGWVETRTLPEPSGSLEPAGSLETARSLEAAGAPGSGGTPAWDSAGVEERAQGWCPTVLDTNGDGEITKPWNEPGDEVDASRDTRVAGFAYGIIPDPTDGSVWVARAPSGVPGSIVRLERGDDPPHSCMAEIYEPPFDNPAVPREEWGFGPRGIDIARDGTVWTALSGSSHLASFDRSECEVLRGPDATGQHCPEGWTLYPAPGPTMTNVEPPVGADYHYYNWVDQFNTLGLGEDVPIANGSTSDALLALDPETGEWVRMRVPYPLGFYSRGLDGRIDDPDAGWKGRGVWADFGTGALWHLEGGKGARSKLVKFQVRPDPLAE